MLPGTGRNRAVALALVIIGSTILIGVAVSGFTGSAGASNHGISSCTEITSPGTYELTADIQNASNEHCIVISASNVTFDGNGHKIVSTTFEPAYAVDASDESNLTVTNVTIRYWGTGVYFWNVTNSTISNVTVEEDPGDGLDPGYSIEFNGIELQSGSDNNTIRDNGLYSPGRSGSTGASGNGILIEGSNDNHVFDNTVFGPAYTGVRLWNAERTNVSSNEIEGDRFRGGSRYGIQIGLPGDGSSNDTVIRDNDVFGRSAFSNYDPGIVDGIAVNEGANTTVEGNLVGKTADQGIVAAAPETAVLRNTVRQSGYEGIGVFASANVTDNTVQSSGRRDTSDGIRLLADDTRIVGNSITSTNGDGLHVDGASNLTIQNNSVVQGFDSDWSVRLTSMPTNETVDSLTLGDTGPITATGTDFKLRGGTLSGVTLPAGQQDIGIVLEAENTSAAGQVRLEATYNDAAVSEIDESTLSMWRYDGGWSEVGGTNGVNTASNVVFANVTTFSRFVPLADNEPPTVGLTATPASVTAGEVVTFDASASFDSDGEIVEYRWDFDGDGTIDEVGRSNRTTHAYAAGGTYDANVTVIDTGDDTNTTSATVSVSAVSAPAGEAWPEYGYDGQNTGYAPNNTGPVADVTEKWSAGVGRIERGSDVLVAGDTVYTEVSPLLAQDPDFVQAVHASNGTERWNYTPGGNIGNLVLEDGLLYVTADGSFGGTIAAVFANTGNVKWSVDQQASTMAVHDGVIYAETDQGLEAFHANNGSQILGFQYEQFDDDQFGPPALYNGTLYVSGEDAGSDEGFVAAIDPDDATEQWRLTNGSRAFTAPVVQNGTVYVGGPSPARVLYAIDADTGTVEWTRSFAGVGEFRTRPTVDEGAVYVTTYGSSGNVTALDASDGDQRWQTGIGVTNTAPALVNETLYLGENSGDMIALNVTDGGERWRQSVGFSSQSHPAVVDGVAYIGSLDNGLYALSDPGTTGPATFSVRIDSTNSPVAPGNTLSVNATVENTGGQSGFQTIALSVDGQPRASEIVTLNPDESSTVTLNWTTTSGDAGSYTAAVESDNESDSTAVSVQNTSASDGGSGLAGFEKTTLLSSSQTTPDSLGEQIAVEGEFAANASAELLQATASNYTLDLTADDGARNVTVYLQTTAISASPDVEDLTMYLDGEEHPFVVNESVGPSASSWVAFNVPNFSTRTVTFSAENATLGLAGGSVDPEMANESTTVTHDVGAVFENVSQDGDTDRFYVTMPDAVSGTNLSVNGVNATDLADGSDVSISSSPELVDGPDEDAVMETVTFAVSPDATDTTDVMVNVSVDVTWPAVEADTPYEIRAAGEDSTTGSVSPTVIAEVTVTSELGPVGDFENAPTDPDGDGFYEDINGNGEVNVVDVQAMFANRDDSVLRNNTQSFDFSGNGEVDIVDVQALFVEVTASDGSVTTQRSVLSATCP